MNKWLIRLGLLFISIAIPLSLLLNAYLFCALVTIQGILLLRLTKKSDNRIMALFLYSTMYNGLIVGGFRFYDLVIIFSAIYVIIKRRFQLRLPLRAVPFMVTLLITIMITGSSEAAFLEVIRFLGCILTLLIMLNIKYDFSTAGESLTYISLVNLWNAIAVYILITSFGFSNINVPGIRTDIYIFHGEIRRNGFFSDPNKYMVFCFAIIMLTEMFIKNRKQKNILMGINIIASVMTASRTSLIIIAVYIFVNILVRLQQKSKKLFYAACLATTLVLMLLAAVVVVAPNVVMDVVNGLYSWTTRLMGRTRTASLMNGIGNDNRVVYWRWTLAFIRKHPFVGQGWGDYAFAIHNSFLELWARGGIVSVLSYFYMFLPLLRIKRKDLIASCYFVSSFMLDLLNYRVWFFLLGVVMVQQAATLKIREVQSRVKSTIVRDPVSIPKNTLRE